MQDVLPYAVGNAHPGFMGWVHGGGTPVGMLAEMLAAGLNANLGGRDQMPIEVERQVLQWVRELFGFPGQRQRPVRDRHLDGQPDRRAGRAHRGAGHRGAPAGHRRQRQAPDRLHLRRRARLHRAGDGPCRSRHRCAAHHPGERRSYEMDIAALEQAIAADRSAGFTPFFIAATAGTVDVGAIDDLAVLADIAHRRSAVVPCRRRIRCARPCWRRILRRAWRGIERADSIAFDFHKWGQVPYDAGFILVRDGALHYDTFASPAAYLRRESLRHGGRIALAVRLRAGSVARLPGAQDLVHHQGLRRGKTGPGDFRHLRAGPLHGAAHRGHADAGTAGAGFAEHRLLPLPLRRMPTG